MVEFNNIIRLTIQETTTTKSKEENTISTIQEYASSLYMSYFFISYAANSWGRVLFRTMFREV